MMRDAVAIAVAAALGLLLTGGERAEAKQLGGISKGLGMAKKASDSMRDLEMTDAEEQEQQERPDDQKEDQPRLPEGDDGLLDQKGADPRAQDAHPTGRRRLSIVTMLGGITLLRHHRSRRVSRIPRPFHQPAEYVLK